MGRANAECMTVSAQGRLDYFKTFLIGLGFFGVSIIWSVYNSYVPIFLQEMGLAAWATGAVMTLDNVMGVTIQPYVGFLSDRTRTKIGRRMPFIIAGAPVAALLFALAPVAVSGGLLILLALLFVFNVAMALYRTPVVSLMPDVTPKKFLSPANGIINFMGGIGAILAFFAGGYAYNNLGRASPFWLAAGVLLGSTILLFLAVKEPKPEDGGAPASDFVDSLRSMFSEIKRLFFESKDRSGAAILLAIFFWFVGYNTIETFFTSYGKWYLGTSEGSASFTLGYLALAFVLFSIPSGYLAMRFNRKRVIMLGLLGGMIFLAIPLATKSLPVISAAVAILGVFWACININSLPIVAELAPSGQTGGYVGLYYLFSTTAAIAAPPVAGLLVDLTGTYLTIFPFAMVAFGIAAAFVSIVRTGI